MAKVPLQCTEERVNISINGSGLVYIFTCIFIQVKMNLDPYLIPHVKVNFRGVIDFDVKSKTIKLIKKL